MSHSVSECCGRTRVEKAFIPQDHWTRRIDDDYMVRNKTAKTYAARLVMRVLCIIYAYYCMLKLYLNLHTTAYILGVQSCALASKSSMYNENTCRLYYFTIVLRYQIVRDYKSARRNKCEKRVSIHFPLKRGKTKRETRMNNRHCFIHLYYKL